LTSSWPFASSRPINAPLEAQRMYSLPMNECV
jgi:hypothetical protein